MNSRNKPVLLLAGATAVGKSAVALVVAEQIGGEIISADALQVYRGLDIGTAKPSAADQARIRHHLIDISEPRERYSAARFRRDAVTAIEDIHSRGRWALVVGGTGFYFRALTEGLFEAPEIDDDIRFQVAAIAESGSRSLVEYLEAYDPETLAEIDRQNPARLRRAVEHHLQTGESLARSRAGTSVEPLPYQWIMRHLTRPREELHQRIEQRTDEMLAGGWVEEVERLLAKFDFSEPAFQAVGYRELQAVVQQHCTMTEARQRIIERTRQYARRQLTWFRNQGNWQHMPATPDVSAKIALGLAESAENKSA